MQAEFYSQIWSIAKQFKLHNNALTWQYHFAILDNISEICPFFPKLKILINVPPQLRSAYSTNSLKMPPHGLNNFSTISTAFTATSFYHF
ncbi:hypothetical protein T4A_14375 [Trichinella pseudospiralis]|uniref:Uncharacterized protein n=1 Tax=Trichinella pseudospiralis TaxID=6337 RepID=A0A0V1DX83_TRIPS|nr:hypothetical protein T4A_14375 [Trichinella pseudospiralis]